LPEVPGADAAALLEVAQRERDDLQRLQYQERIATDQIVLARGAFLPTISFESNYFRRYEDVQSTYFLDEGWTVGGRLDFALYEGGLRLAERAQARLRRDQAQLAITQQRKQIELDVTQAALNLDASARVLASRQDQQRFAARNYEIVASQFTFGLATNIDLLDANQTLIEAELDVIRATLERHVAILALQRSVGVFLDRALHRAEPA
jgi:outer membrane protein TolC